MSYMVMRVYHFLCDAPDPHNLPSSGADCGTYEALPYPGAGLRGAEKEIRHFGWKVRGGKHYCPAHAEDPS